MPNAIRGIVQDYGWTNLAIGLLSNTLFFSGSNIFLPAFELLRPAPIRVFICGSAFILIGVLGPLLVSLCEN